MTPTSTPGTAHLASLSARLAYEALVLGGGGGGSIGAGFGFGGGGRPMDTELLAGGCGPKSTEALIEAVFNPVPTHLTTVSPFTYHVPRGEGVVGVDKGKGNKDKDKDVDVDGKPGPGSEAASMYSITGSSSSEDVQSSAHGTTTTRSSSGRWSTRSWRSRSSHNLKEQATVVGIIGGGGGNGENGKSTRWWKKFGSQSRPGTPG